MWAPPIMQPGLHLFGLPSLPPSIHGIMATYFQKNVKTQTFFIASFQLAHFDSVTISYFSESYTKNSYKRSSLITGQIWQAAVTVDIICQNNRAFCIGQRTLSLGVFNSKKFPLGGRFSTDFRPKVTDQPRIFCLASIWSCTEASKLEAVKSTLLDKSCSNKKILADLLLQILKLV